MSRTIDDIVSSVDQSRSSWAIVGTLWKHFELPSASAPADLVPISRDFERIYGLLDAEYRRTKNESVKAGIMGIYATMSADTNVRGKVFRKGIVSKLVPLASNPQCRTVALISLATIASNGDVQERVELAKACARPLLQLLQEPDVDSFATYLCLMALTNACMGPLDGHALAMYPRLLASLPIPEVVRALTEGLHRLTGAPDLVRTAAAFFSLGVPQLELTPSANNFLIAGLRSADLKVKGRCLSALICRYGEVWEPDNGTANHTKYAACCAGIQRAPQNLRSAIQAFGGVDRCEFAVTLDSDSDFQTALQRAYADRDMYALGKAMAPLLLRGETPFADGMYQTINRTTGRAEALSRGLPFTRWADAMPLCAKAIREKRMPEEADLADMLDMKYLIIRHKRLAEAMQLARRALQRNRDFAFAYYVLALPGEDDVAGLRAAKRGLKCPATEESLFLRTQFLQRAVEMAADLGAQILLGGPPDEDDQRHGVATALFLGAMEDAEQFLAEAPPDNRHRPKVLYYYTLLQIAFEDEISPNLHEIKSTLDALRTAEDFRTWLTSSPPPNTQLRLAQQNVVKHYRDAQEEWADVLSASQDAESQQGTARATGNEYVKWLHRIDFAEFACLGPGGANPAHWRTEKPKLYAWKECNVELYRCAWCRTAALGLLQCSACGGPRYCDATCQKRDWKAHKTTCPGRKN